MPSALRVVQANTQDSRDLERDGWVVVARSWGAQLNAADCDLPQLRTLVDRVASIGQVQALTPTDVTGVLALDAATAGDYPGLKATTHAPLSRATATAGPARCGYGILETDGALLAMTFVDVELERRRAEVDFTTVAADRRGSGLATAVKAASILDLLAKGIEVFRTGGSTENAAILAANRSVGSVVDEEWLAFAPGRSGIGDPESDEVSMAELS